MGGPSYFWAALWPSPVAAPLGMGTCYSTTWFYYEALARDVLNRWAIAIPREEELAWFPDNLRPTMMYSPAFIAPVEFAPVAGSDGRLAGVIFRWAKI